jgi:molecular chaperone DnaJ
MKDYYKILGVEENASDETIKKEYRKLSKQYHPDVNPEGSEKFKEIAEAYEVLSNPEKRTQYNMSKNNPFNGGDLDSFFKNMFGGGNPFQQNRRQKTAPDKIIKVEVSPIESYLGSQKSITYFRNHSCNPCKGTGGEQLTCASCGGSGAQIRTFGTGFMVQQIRTTCETCGGKGFTLVNKCYFCDGRGVKTESSEIKIQLPVGIDDGQFLKLVGLGDFSNGQYGDLVVQVMMVKDDTWEKMNQDLIYNLYLDYDTLMSNTYKIPHPDGELNVNAPNTKDTSKPLRLKGKGYGGGDMFVKLYVRFDKEKLKK